LTGSSKAHGAGIGGRAIEGARFGGDRGTQRAAFCGIIPSSRNRMSGCMSGLKLSVVLCTFNGAAYLQPQLDTLLSQTRLPNEVVVGDDGSSDGTQALLEAFAEHAAVLGVQVQLILRDRNLGFVRNFSESLGAASGDVLVLCDQDDVWHPDKLAVMVDRFADDPSLLLLCSDARLVDAQGNDLRSSLFEALELSAGELRSLHQGRAFDVLLRRSMVTGATAAFRRELLALAMPVGPGWIHDEWLAMIAAVTGRVDALEQPLIDYRQHGGNQIGMRKRNWVDKWNDLLRPRGDQFRTEVQRLESLQKHLASLDPGAFDEALRHIAHKHEHFARRVSVGRRSRWSRLPLVLQQAANGNYRRYGTGGRSMLRDLLRHD
jgi:glycosyltransferase involved in cell wall biosynthesis